MPAVFPGISQKQIKLYIYFEKCIALTNIYVREMITVTLKLFLMNYF